MIQHAHTWEDPIRIEHFASGKSMVVHVNERGVQLDQALDTAALVVRKGDIPFPDDVLPLIPRDRSAKVGLEIGWVGFPALAAENLCFFSGRVSAWVQKERAYLVDGVAINGVSGGPAILTAGPFFWIIGVLSAYAPNRVTGEVLPGVCVVRDVKQLQAIIEQIKSLQEAKKKETPPVTTQASPEEGAQSGATGTGDVEPRPAESPS